MLRGALDEPLVTEVVGSERFIMDFVKRWNPIVPSYSNKVAVSPTNLSACPYIFQTGSSTG